MTRFVILQGSEDGTYTEMGDVEASGRDTAVRKYIKDYGAQVDGAGTSFAAIPLRSWHPVTVKSETKTQLRFS